MLLEIDCLQSPTFVTQYDLHGLGKGSLTKKTADLVTLSQSVSVGQDENTISGNSDILSMCEGVEV